MTRTSIDDSYSLIVDATSPILVSIMRLDSQIAFNELLKIVFDKMFLIGNENYLYDYVYDQVKHHRKKWYVKPLLNQLFQLDKFISKDYRYMVGDLVFNNMNKHVLTLAEFDRDGQFIYIEFEVVE
jgi:hypothetical protein